MRLLTYSAAINEALFQMMESDPSVFVIGQGITSPWYVGNTAQGLSERFGGHRVIDTPVSENCITGSAVGAALAGMKPVVVHPRMDFMLFAMDPIINQAANWYYMSGGKSAVPVVIWGIINRGGEQAAQHSQAFHSMFANVPGLKVVMPSTPFDAKGLMISAIRESNPVVFVDDRHLYGEIGPVPEHIYEVRIGQAHVRRIGADLTIVTVSKMCKECLAAAECLSQEKIQVEIIDLRSVKPIDTELIYKSVKKTGRLIIADGGWKTCGLAAEISALVAENNFESLKAPIIRVTLPDCPAPASSSLEKDYYPNADAVARAVRKVLNASEKPKRQIDDKI